MRKLHNLFAANRGRGAPLALVRNGADVTIEVYDVIVSSEADAQWLGGCPADVFCRELRSLTAGDTAHIRVNSPGGDVFAGVAMAQAVRECAATVIVHVDGYAASAASLIVAAAPDSVIAPAAMVMIHKAWTIALGNADDLMETASLLDKVDGELAATYQAKAGGTAEEWLAAMAAETWYTGSEAVEAGLVTRVAETAARPKNSFDLGVYARAPKAAEAEPESEDTDAAAALAVAADIERRKRVASATLCTAA
jgi:ATP-dependent Clp protease, protease subunit